MTNLNFRDKSKTVDVSIRIGHFDMYETWANEDDENDEKLLSSNT